MSDAQQSAQSIVNLFLGITRYQRYLSQNIKRETGESGRRVAILRCLIAQSPRSVGEIGEYLYVSDATVSRILDDMETDGFVTRVRCKRDSRRVLVSPTDLGRELALRAPDNAIGLMRQRLPELPVSELEQIESALGRLWEIVQVNKSVVER